MEAEPPPSNGPPPGEDEASAEQEEASAAANASDMAGLPFGLGWLGRLLPQRASTQMQPPAAATATRPADRDRLPKLGPLDA